MANKRNILIDGANVAYAEKTKSGKPKVENIVHVIRKLESLDFDPIVIIDASFRYDVDEPEKLEKLIDEGKVRQAPAGTDADYFIIQMSQELKAKIITNDQYDEYKEKYEWILKKRVPLMIVKGEIIFYRLQSML